MLLFRSPYLVTHLKGLLDRIFNFKLSRVRKIIENSFDIISSTFRVLRKHLLLESNKT